MSRKEDDKFFGGYALKKGDRLISWSDNLSDEGAGLHIAKVADSKGVKLWATPEQAELERDLYELSDAWKVVEVNLEIVELAEEVSDGD